MHEQRVVSSSGYDSDFDSVFWIPVQELIIHKYLKVLVGVQLISNLYDYFVTLHRTIK